MKNFCVKVDGNKELAVAIILLAAKRLKSDTSGTGFLYETHLTDIRKNRENARILSSLNTYLWIGGNDILHEAHPTKNLISLDEAFNILYTPVYHFNHDDVNITVDNDGIKIVNNSDGDIVLPLHFAYKLQDAAKKLQK